MIYQELKEGAWHDYRAALAACDFETAWQVLVHLALVGRTPSERIRVEDAAFEAMRSESVSLVRGAVEALSILLRFRHPVDRTRFSAAKATLHPSIINDERARREIEEEIEDTEGWWTSGER